MINNLKFLTSLPLSIGTVVHDVIKDTLKRFQKVESPIDKGRLKDHIRKLATEFYNQNTFFEYYYKERNDDFFEYFFEEIQLRFNLFLNSSTFSFILREALPRKSEWVIEPGRFGETRIDGMKAYCKVDFLSPINGHFYIYDWKTGKTSIGKHKKQMIGYSYWAAEEFGVQKSDIKPVVVYLNSEHLEEKVKLSDDDIKRFPNDVRDETMQMHKYCTNIEENIPKNQEEFEKTDKTYICNYCNFKELCS